MKWWAVAAALFVASPAAAQEQWYTLASPNGANAVVIGADAGGTVTYAVERKGERLIAASPIVLDLANGSLGYGMTVTGGAKPFTASGKVSCGSK